MTVNYLANAVSISLSEYKAAIHALCPESVPAAFLLGQL